MPNESFDIRLFNKGIISNIDAPDVLPEAAVWSQNIDSQSEMGTLKGIPEVSYNLGHSINFKRGAIISKTIDSALKHIVVYTDEANIKVDDNVLTNDAANTITTSYNSNGTTFQTLNDLCYIGRGDKSNIIAGYIKNGLQFNGVINWNNIGVNDLSIDIIEASVSATKTFKVKILRAGKYPITSINIATGKIYSATLPLLGEEVRLELILTEQLNNSTSLQQLTATVTYIDPNAEFFMSTFSPLDAYITYTGTYHSKHPDTILPIDTYHWTNDESDPIYTLANKKWLVEKEHITLSDNVKIYFEKKTGHTKDTLWTIVINPISNLFFIEPNESTMRQISSQGLIISTTNGFQGTPGAFSVVGGGISYAISYIYDYLTETPLYTQSSFHFTGTGSMHSVEIIVTPSKLNKRITGINIYMGLTLVGATKPLGYYRMIKSLTIAPNSEFTKMGYGDSFNYQLVNKNEISNSYESNSGLSQDIDNFNVNYTYSTKIDSNLFIGKCYNAQVPNAERLIFKSKAFRFNTFDWTQDFLVLDFIPLGMAAFAGKLLVFGTNKIVKINPEQFYIEETIEGIGCKSHDFITTNDDGIFWGDNNYAYHFNGQAINKISITIKNTSNVNDSTNTTQKSWSSFAETGSFCLTDNKRRVVLFVSINEGIAFIWDIDAKRWDFMRIDLDLIGGLTFPDGIIRFFKDYAVDSDLITYKIFSSSTRKNFIFYTKELDFEQAGVEKRLRRVKVDYEGAIPTIAYRVDNQASWTSCTINNILNLEFYKIQFKIIGTATTEVKSISIIYRPLRID